jgi:hypothetical protein
VGLALQIGIEAWLERVQSAAVATMVTCLINQLRRFLSVGESLTYGPPSSPENFACCSKRHSHHPTATTEFCDIKGRLQSKKFLNGETKSRERLKEL